MTSPRRPSATASLQAGFSLIELMIALAVGLVLIAATMTIFVSSNQSRQIVEQVGQQIDNGAYAMQVLSADLGMAGYVAELDMTNAVCGTPATAGCLAVPTTKPDPCDTTVTDYPNYLTMPVQGYDLYNGSPTISCISDVRANTDVVVVRRISTCANSGSTGSCINQSGAPYFQASLCQSQLSGTISQWYRLDTNLTNLDRLKRDCATTANKYRYVTDIYFVANNDQPNDGIPTLKRAQLGGSSGNPVFTTVPIAEGVENMQIEYGIDTTSSGYPSTFMANPDSSGVSTWSQVMAVKIHLLVRNTTALAKYQDTKTYNLGLKADGTTNTIPAANDGYKRHVFSAETRLFNPASRIEAALGGS